MKNKSIFIDRILSIFLYINILQVITIWLIIVFDDDILLKSVSTEQLYTFRIMIIILGALAMANVINSYNSLKFIKENNMIISVQEDSLDQIKNLNNVLRAQRHDFLNNLQVVYSLMQLDEYDDAKEYIEEVYKDIKKVSKVMRTKDVAINALLQAKILDSESKQIYTTLDITSTLEKLEAPSWQMCRVLGNLIDNAIFELCKLKSKRELEIYIGEELNNIIFVVKNNGSPIPEEIREKIFEPNFTTKGSKGQGMGLSITKEIVCENGGSIELNVDKKWTSFEVKVPINIQSKITTL